MNILKLMALVGLMEILFHILPTVSNQLFSRVYLTARWLVITQKQRPSVGIYALGIIWQMFSIKYFISRDFVAVWSLLWDFSSICFL